MAVQSWSMLDRAERDAVYDNAAAITNKNEWIRIRNEQAAAYRHANGLYLDVPYAEGDRTKWDLFPAARADAPCLVFIHGGYWQMNRREDFSGFAAGMAERGWSVALPGYTLAPKARLTQIVQELRVSLDWLGHYGTNYGIGGKIHLCGWSAGGHVAAMLLDHERVTAGLAISGIFELGPLRDTFLNDALQLSDEEVKKLSPLRLPPVPKDFAIAYGTAELPALIDESRRFHQYRASFHAPGQLIPVINANHFEILESLRRSGGILARFLSCMAQGN